MKAIIKIDVPDFQIGQEVNIHFKDSMVAKGVVKEEKIGEWIDTDNYYQRWKCSICGWHTRDAEPTYCPWCGSKNGKESVSIHETREVGESKKPIGTVDEVVDEIVDESVDECHFLCQWNSGLRCTRNPNERNCHKRVSGEVGERE